MKKIKTLLLLTLCALPALCVNAQVNNAQDVIDMLTANGGYCQAVYYSATYQKDDGHDENWKSTNNMWIKDSFGKSRFVQKLDSNNQPVVGNVIDWQGDVMKQARVVTLVDAFGGLFDWDFYITENDEEYVCTAQPSEAIFPVKNDDSKYVRVHMMSNLPPNSMPEYGVYIPKKKTQEWEISDDPHTLQLWTSINDIENYEWIGVTPWGDDKFDVSLFLNAFMANRWYFLRLAVKDKGADGIIGTEDDKEDYHYDFYLAEFRHYNPNTTIGDKLNGTSREFHAIANYDEATREFSIYNFSDFGPSFTQPMGSGKGYGEGLEATISPIKGKLFSDGTLLIKRQPGYVHYNRAYENGNDPFDCSITKWDDCWTAGVITDADGNYYPNNLQLKRDITGTWEGAFAFHHHSGNINTQASNPWVTDGGSCRTRENVKLHIDPYVYSTDAQLDNNEYDTDDPHGRGGIYELVTAQVDGDITLQLAIDNKEDYFGNRKLQHSIYAFEKDKGTEKYLACPVMFDVTANEQYVDHYEVCVYRGAGDTPVASADDAAFDNKSSKLNTVMTPTATYILPKNDTGHYEAFELAEDVQKVSSKDVMNHPNYSKVLTVPVDDHDSEETLTFYVKAIYTAESGLAPTYHSLENVLFHITDGFPTAVEDVNVEGVKAVSGVYSINGQYVGTEVPAGNGIYVVRYTDGSAAKVAVK